MKEEKDFDVIQPVFFSTSQAGQAGPNVGVDAPTVLKDAYSIEALKECEVVITCQGS